MRKTSKKSTRQRREKGSSLPSLRIAVLICVLVFIVVAAGALMAPGLKVTEISCEGCVHLNQADVINAAQLSAGENIFIANTGRARRAIEDIPFVSEVSVKRVFPDKIKIVVSERIPAGYIPHGSEYALIDNEGIVLELIEYGVASAIEEYSTPAEELKSAAAKEYEENEQADASGNQEDEEIEVTEDEEAEEADETEDEALEDSQESDKPVFERPYSVPLIKGITLKEADCGKKVKSGDEEKLYILLNICRALNGPGLLNRATYLDIENVKEIRLIIENRVDIRLGDSDNMEYRAKFLAEVINTKISAYEHVIMDYHGADIYVRSPEDGKDRIVPKQTEDEETEEDEDEDEDEESEGESDEE